jgi:hypothetical protein
VVVGHIARWLRDERAASPNAGHAWARCHDDRRTLTVNHGSADLRDQRICTSRSSQVDQYRSSKLAMRVRFPSPAPTVAHSSGSSAGHRPESLILPRRQES